MEKAHELHINSEAFNILLEYAEKNGLKSPTKGGKVVLAIEHIAANIDKIS